MEEGTKHYGVVVLVILIALAAFFAYYFFIDTLNFSQIIGHTGNPIVDVGIKFLDFDTGLTRYDVSRLRRQSDYWAQRIEKIYSIQDPHIREIENEKLLREMMHDPSMKKLAKKVFGGRTESLLKILRALNR